MDDEPHGIEPMQLGPEIIQRIAAGHARVWLVSPYVTSDTAIAALCDSAAPSKRLLTRYNVSDILAESTSLRAIETLVTRRIDVRALEDIHAKIYIIDDWVYIGSANLTNRGLEPSLREFGITSIDVNHIRRVVRYFECVWDVAGIVSQELLKVALEQLEHMRLDVEHVRCVRKEAEERLAHTAFAPRTPVGRKGETPSTQNATRDSLEEVLTELGGSVAVARAIARVFAYAIRSVPNFESSEHWTLNQQKHHLRFNLGNVEILTMVTSGVLGLVALPETLPETEREEIESAGGVVVPTPYQTVRRIAPGGLWIQLPLTQVARFERLLCSNLETYITRDKSSALSQHRHALSVAAVHTIARMAEDAGLAKLVAKLEAGMANE